MTQLTIASIRISKRHDRLNLVGAECGLTNHLVFSGRYTHKNLDRTIEDVGFIDALGNENFFIANPGLGIVSQPFARVYRRRRWQKRQQRNGIATRQAILAELFLQR